MKRSHLKYLVALAIVLLLPFVELVLPARPRSNRYMTFPEGLGRFGTVERDIFEDPRDGAIVLLGSSGMLSAIDPRVVKADIAEKTGAEPIVHVLALNQSGSDVQYIMLHDYLKTHKPKLVVIQTPWHVGLFKGTSFSLGQFANMADYGWLTEGLSLRDKVSVYCQMAAYAPRFIFDSFETRPLQLEELTDDARLEYVKNYRWPGSYGKSLATIQPYVSDKIAPAWIKTLAQLRPEAAPSSSGSEKFYVRIYDYLTSQKIPFVFLYLPEISDIGRPPHMAADNPLSGLPGTVPVICSSLFEAPWLPDNPKRLFYDDIHLDAYGALPFTHSVTTQIARLYSGGTKP